MKKRDPIELLSTEFKNHKESLDAIKEVTIENDVN